LREKVEAQELKLRKLRALRGQADNANKANNNNNNNNASLTNDLESIRRLFNEKEKELAMAVTKVSPAVFFFVNLRNCRVAISLCLKKFLVKVETEGLIKKSDF
jgi:hypothetical protein